MSVITKDLGAATAYAYAVEKGYTGTEAEFAELMADYANVGQRAEDAADSALESKSAAQTAAQTATNKASEATQAAQTATTKATEAQADADAAALDASQAMSAASTATSKATEATTAAATAVSSKDAAVSANTAAQSAKTAAQTAQQGAETARDAVQSSAAQIATNAEDITQLKEEFSDITSGTDNIFNDDLIVGTGITKNGHTFSGTAISFFNAFGTAGTAIPVDAEANVAYRLTFNAFCATSWTGNGLLIQFLYTDNTTDYAIIIPNSTTTPTAFNAVTDSTKTLAGLIFAYGTGQSIVWTISDIMLVDGVAESYIPYKTAYDRIARDANAHINSVFVTIPGKNIFDTSGHVDGYLNPNGTIHANSGSKAWKTTDFIPVSDIDYLSFSAYVIAQGKRALISMFFFTTYDSSRTLINQSSSGYKTYAIEDGVAYIRFSYGGTAGTYSDYQLEANDTYTGYQPYKTFNALNDSLYQTWYDKKWVCVGDSLTEQNSRTDKHYYDYVSDKTGIHVHVMGVGGTGYIRGQADNNAFYQRISAVPTDADVITIFGSLNDLGSGSELGTKDDTGTTTIGGCINSTLDNLFAVMPLANVGIVSPTPWNAEQYDSIHEPNAASAYCELLKAICKKRSIPYLDLFHKSLLRPWDATFRQLAYSKDEGSGTHPDENGHKLIAPRFKGFLDSLIV